MQAEGSIVPDNPIDAIGAAARTATGVVSAEVEEQLRSSHQARAIASERASVRALSGGSQATLIIAGDFNLPVESTIYRRFWSGFTNAFEEVGNGLGWTKREGLLHIRIDHVLMRSKSLVPRRAVVGRDWYSDHLPVIVDIERVK
jgi:endonuclease/exonuclease/phosphatase (EEP) superfamily protein YafD